MEYFYIFKLMQMNENVFRFGKLRVFIPMKRSFSRETLKGELSMYLSEERMLLYSYGEN